MDIHSYVDALVGVIATGEVSLWKHSKDHLRFLHCDFMNEVERGENFWIARRKKYYEEKGLIRLPQRLVPRDLDATRGRFAMSKEFITNYKHGYTTEAVLILYYLVALKASKNSRILRTKRKGKNRMQLRREQETRNKLRRMLLKNGMMKSMREGKPLEGRM